MPETSPLVVQPFRLLFLGAALFASLGMTLWSVFLHLGWMPETTLSPLLWHGHEMLFGFASALVGGFLLTAVANWTGHATSTPLSLLFLVTLWLAARVAFLVPGTPYDITATVDCLYFPVLAVMIGIPIFRKRDYWHFIVIGILAGLATLDVLFHLSVTGHIGLSPTQVLIWVIDFLSVMMVVVGGRIVPFFTERRVTGVKRIRWVERTTNAAPMLLTVVDIVAPGSLYVGVLSSALVALILIRMYGWKPWAVLQEPMLWVMHLGYLWLAVGFALRGISLLGHGFPELTALHAITAGALGSLAIGMMTRVPLGHTGRAMQAGKVMTVAFVLVNIAGLLRAAVPSLWPLAGMLWVLTFGIYFVRFLPIHFGSLRAD